jgi:hypothetical protein
MVAMLIVLETIRANLIRGPRSVPLEAPIWSSIWEFMSKFPYQELKMILNIEMIASELIAMLMRTINGRKRRSVVKGLGFCEEDMDDSCVEKSLWQRAGI